MRTSNIDIDMIYSHNTENSHQGWFWRFFGSPHGKRSMGAAGQARDRRSRKVSPPPFFSSAFSPSMVISQGRLESTYSTSLKRGESTEDHQVHSREEAMSSAADIEMTHVGDQRRSGDESSLVLDSGVVAVAFVMHEVGHTDEREDV
jgi:hypothetical protein